MFCHNTHVSDIIPTTDRQQSIGLRYKFFQEQHQNSRKFPIFPGVVAPKYNYAVALVRICGIVAKNPNMLEENRLKIRIYQNWLG